MERNVRERVGERGRGERRIEKGERKETERQRQTER